MSERSPVRSRLSFSMAAIACFRASRARRSSSPPAAATALAIRAVTFSDDISTFNSRSVDFISSARRAA
jgi:hypothetical protein